MEPLYIGGEYVASASGRGMDVENPATEEVTAQIPEASEADVDQAVASARRALAEWRMVDALERARLLHAYADRLEQRADELTILLTREGGKTLKENRDEIRWSATAFRHLGEMARASRGRVVGPTKAGQLNMVLNEPVGVVVHILPFNYPVVLLAWQVAAALASGNSCIVKPSEHHAIELANGSVFGLGASIYTASLETAMRAATELQAGTVWINDPLKDNDAAPFGGVKFSGLGRELGTEGIAAFTQPKHVHMDFAQAPSPEWWFPYQRPAIDAGST